MRVFDRHHGRSLYSPPGMKFDEVAAALEGVPFMSQGEGRRVYDHIWATRAKEVLEIGTAHGVSAAYMAAALDEGGGGGVTTVDTSAVRRDPPRRMFLTVWGSSIWSGSYGLKTARTPGG
jgi:hypothetical protein